MTWQQLSSGAQTSIREMKYAGRTLARTPGFSLVAILVMALCIGASTSLFTIVRSVLLRPLPFRDPDHLVMIRDCVRTNQMSTTFSACGAVSPGDYFDWRQQTHGFEDMASWQWWSFNLSGGRGELPEVVDAAGGTWNLFSVLGVRPALGRTFTEAEDNLGGDTVILTWSFFERRFGGDPGIVGKQIHLDGKSFTVIGVLPPTFNYPDAKVQVWVPYLSITPDHAVHQHARHMTYVVARVRPNVSLSNAISEVSSLQYSLAQEHPTEAVSDGVAPESLLDDLERNVKKPLALLMCSVLCMLFIGCLNIANLLVARGATRQREIAIRSALGAQRSVLMREQLMEILLVCLTGGISGVLLSLVATQWMAHAWKDLPSAQGVHLDGMVLAFALLLVLLAALLAGLLPAITSTGRTVLQALQSSARTTGGSVSRTFLRKALLTIEIAVTVTLLVSAGLLLKSFLRMRTTDIGCVTDNVLSVSFGLPKQKYDTPEKVTAFDEAILDRVREIPGVRAVGLGATLPGGGNGEDDVFRIAGHPEIVGRAERPRALIRQADPGFFNALDIPLIHGRFFTSQDRLENANKVIISRELARKYLSGEDPVGRHLSIPLWSNTQYEIVGVVGDALHQVDKPTQATIYFSALSGAIYSGGTLAIRTESNPLGYSLPVQKAFASLDPELPVSNILTLQQVIGNSINDVRFSATLTLVFAVLSLALASVGLYGVLSYLTTQRTTEIGIRMALGAQKQQVLGLMLFDGLRPALFGVGIGIVASIAETRVLQSMMYGTKPLDPVVYGTVSSILLFVAVVACMVPAWRASQLDPVKALRAD